MTACRGRRLPTALATMGLALVLGACGTANGSSDEIGPDGSSTSEIDPVAEQEAQAGWSEMERHVIQGLGDFEPGPKAVRYENDEERVRVTIWTEGETFTEERLKGIQTRAEELADEVAKGTPVVVETTDSDPPRLAPMEN